MTLLSSPVGSRRVGRRTVDEARRLDPPSGFRIRILTTGGRGRFLSTRPKGVGSTQARHKAHHQSDSEEKDGGCLVP